VNKFPHEVFPYTSIFARQLTISHLDVNRRLGAKTKSNKQYIKNMLSFSGTFRATLLLGLHSPNYSFWIFKWSEVGNIMHFLTNSYLVNYWWVHWVVEHNMFVKNAWQFKTCYTIAIQCMIKRFLSRAKRWQDW